MSSGRRGWIVGVAVVAAVLAYVTLNSLRTEGPGSRGLRAGTAVPEFAVPLALSDLSGDANVAQPGPNGSRSACEVRGSRVLNVCQLFGRSPLVLAFVPAREGDCDRQLDRLERVRRAFPQVSFAAVAGGGEREALRALIRERGWRFPVGYDRHGDVFALYGIAVCPALTLVYPGGKTRETRLGLESEASLRRAVQALVRATKERA